MSGHDWYPPRNEWWAVAAAYLLIVCMAVLVVLGVAGVIA